MSILVDPWLSGSCYWRSWWHFPPNTKILPEHLNPDYVYLSHHHFDHFHYPSLRRISKSAHVLFPKFAVDVMCGELEHLGFTKLMEMPHGEVMCLPGGTRLASYQYGQDDSAFVVEKDGLVIADLNDCKIGGTVVRPMLKAFGPPTVMFKSHSFAQAYPNCYTFHDPADAQLLTREDFLDTFVASVREVQPKYAVPFASMVAFLHPDSYPCNIYAVRPPEVVKAVEKSGLDTQALLMVPGDTWDSNTGVQLSSIDYYSNVSAWLDRLATSVAPKLEQAGREERGVRLGFDVFRNYFGGFLKSLPVGVPMALRRPVVFHVPASSSPYWILDFKARRVHQETSLPASYASLIRISEGVLADAIEKRVVNFIHVSMRIKIDVTPGGIQTDFLFWGLLTLFELGYLPLFRCATPRALGVLWRRRSEMMAFGRSLLRWRSLDETIFDHLKMKRSRPGSN